MNALIYYVGCSIFVLLTFFVPLYNIANSELLEEFSIVKNMITDNKKKDKNRWRLFILRAILLIVSIAPGLLTEEVAVVLNLAGGVAIPIISFYLPIILNFMSEKAYGLKRFILWDLHDVIIFILSIGMQVMTLKYSIENHLLK